MAEGEKDMDMPKKVEVSSILDGLPSDRHSSAEGQLDLDVLSRLNLILSHFHPSCSTVLQCLSPHRTLLRLRFDRVSVDLMLGETYRSHFNLHSAR